VSEYNKPQFENKLKNVLYAKWEAIRRNQNFIEDCAELKANENNPKKYSGLLTGIAQKWGLFNPPVPQLPANKIGYTELMGVFNEGLVKLESNFLSKIITKAPEAITVHINLNGPNRRIKAELDRLLKSIDHAREKLDIIASAPRRNRTPLFDLSIFRCYDICESNKDKMGKINFTKATKKLYGTQHLDENRRTLQNRYHQAKKLIEGGYRHIK
jgi:hypothetical protein